MSFLSLIIKNLLRNKIRSILTSVGIGIGIAVVITFLTFATNLNQSYMDIINRCKGDLIVCQKAVQDITSSSIDQDYIHEIKRYKEVEKAYGQIITNISLRDIPSFLIFGIDPEDIDIYLGSEKPTLGKKIRHKGEIMIGKIASYTFRKKVEDLMELGPNKRFKVTGIYETGNAFLDSGGIVTLRDAQEIANLKGRVSAIVIDSKMDADTRRLSSMIEVTFPDLLVIRSSDFINTQKEVKSINRFAWIFSLLAIVIGGIVVMNTLIMSVFERTREVGILIAVGWRRGRILKMIWGESLILGAIGFVIGVILGIVGVLIIASTSTHINASFHLGTFLIALSVSLVLSIVGALYPAYRTSKILPAIAIRYE
ncbi:MAG: FtsX-like permease family protein [bacterium]|nr:FtsX-like permease family protein [bacterium]